jgi:hypothetical protein
VTVSKFIFLLSLIMFGCGKVQQMQDSVSNMLVSNDVRNIEVFEGKVFKAPSKNDSYLTYAQVQYKIGSLTVDGEQTWSSLTINKETEIYFKGTFSKRSGFSPAPSTEYDVIDFDLLKKK